MPTPFRHRFCAFALLAAATALRAGDAPAETLYRPLLEPHFTAGQTFRYDATADYRSLILSVDHVNSLNDDGSPLKKDITRANLRTHFTVEFSADVAVAREVFKNGSLREAEFHVARCQAMNDAGLQTLIPPGSILGARMQPDGQIAFAINGVAPDPELAAQLCALIVLGNEQATNNDLLGPPKPEAVDATWPVNLNAVMKSSLPECFPGVKSVVGSVNLVTVNNAALGAPQAVVNADYSLIGVKPPFNEQLTPDPSTVNFNILATVPANGGPGAYELKLKSTISHSAHSGNAHEGMAASNAEFNIYLEQTIHFITSNPPPANLALDQAPGEPPAPPVPPGLSAAIILRTPVSWVGGTEQERAAKMAQANHPASGTTTTPPAPQPAPPADTTPIQVNQDTSPFSHAQSASP